MPSKQFFSYIMERTDEIKKDLSILTIFTYAVKELWVVRYKK
jgi:hypothetical protein